MTRAAALAALAGLVLVLGANGGVKLRVAYVTDAVAVTDHAAGQNAYDGFLRAARRLGRTRTGAARWRWPPARSTT
jgi:hypothetical protein